MISILLLYTVQMCYVTVIHHPYRIQTESVRLLVGRRQKSRVDPIPEEKSSFAARKLLVAQKRHVAVDSSLGLDGENALLLIPNHVLLVPRGHVEHLVALVDLDDRSLLRMRERRHDDLELGVVRLEQLVADNLRQHVGTLEFVLRIDGDRDEKIVRETGQVGRNGIQVKIVVAETYIALEQFVNGKGEVTVLRKNNVKQHTV